MGTFSLPTAALRIRAGACRMVETGIPHSGVFEYCRGTEPGSKNSGRMLFYGNGMPLGKLRSIGERGWKMSHEGWQVLHQCSSAGMSQLTPTTLQCRQKMSNSTTVGAFPLL